MIKIQHIEDIKKIRNIEKTVKGISNIPLFDISTWNSGEQYKHEIMKKYHTPSVDCIQDYKYSYEINNNIKEKIIKKIGVDDEKKCVIFPSSTTAICCICDYLKKNNYDKICILEPSYFSVAPCLDSFGVSYYKEYISLDENGIPIIPFSSIVNNKYNAVWITSPIFSTGIYYERQNLCLLKKLNQKGIFLIIDESISSPNKYIANTFQENTISIISPPKYIGINSQKFSAVICDYPLEQFLFDWIDVFCGSLSNSVFLAINHFLSQNYNECVCIHDNYINKSILLINELIKHYPNNYFSGQDCTYITMQNKKKLYCSNIDYNFFYKFMKHTNASIIPGYINNFSPRWGFCYRINLTVNHNDLTNYLGRIFNFFD
ncbi:MAG: hypothetical protein KH210_10660 [Roseburia sp.]|nr:hypothetical protein [Roseburia sp.]